MGTVDALCEAFNHYRTGCACKKIELIEILVCLALVLIRGDKTNKDCGFDLGF